MNKRFLVTGANSGIGLATCYQLAYEEQDIIMLCRNERQARSIMMTFAKHYPKSNTSWYTADLADLEQVEEAAERILEKHEHIDGIYNNAGASIFQYGESPQGVELNMAINVLGPYHLTNKLIPLLKNSKDPRILNVAGIYYKKAKFNLEQQSWKQDFKPMDLANLAQLNRVLWTMELAERLTDTNICVNAYHPGAVRTPLQDKLPPAYRWMAQLMGMFFASPEKAALIVSTLLMDEELKGLSGKYFNRLKMEELTSEINEENKALLWSYLDEKVKGSELNIK